jgi:hypothetical protein
MYSIKRSLIPFSIYLHAIPKLLFNTPIQSLKSLEAVFLDPFFSFLIFFVYVAIFGNFRKSYILSKAASTSSKTYPLNFDNSTFNFLAESATEEPGLEISPSNTRSNGESFKYFSSDFSNYSPKLNF